MKESNAKSNNNNYNYSTTATAAPITTINADRSWLIYRKIPKISDTRNFIVKSWTRWRFLGVMHPKDAEGIANSVDPDCPDLSVRKLIGKLRYFQMELFDWDFSKPKETSCPLFLKMSHRMAKPTKWHVHPAKTKISLGEYLFGHAVQIIKCA